VSKSKNPIEIVPAIIIDDPLLTSVQVCEYLIISPRTLKRLTKKKALSFIRLSGGAFHFRKSDVEAVSDHPKPANEGHLKTGQR